MSQGLPSFEDDDRFAKKGAKIGDTVARELAKRAAERERSAQTCGCDIAVNWTCEAHQKQVAADVMATFASGAKSTEVKPRYDLIPAEAMKREAVRWAEGAATHGARNWQKGVDDAQFILDRTNHLVEHAILYANGDRSTDHLGAIRANAAMLAWFEARKP